MKGKQNARADALSQRPDYQPINQDNTGIVGIPDDLIFTNYPLQADNRAIMADFSSIDRSLRDSVAQETQDERIDVEIEIARTADETLTKWSKDENGLLSKGHQIYIPMSDTLRGCIIQEHHDTMLVGHPEIERTLENIQRGFWWPRMRCDVTEYVQACQPCQRS